jgi:hypothetical protein
MSQHARPMAAVASLRQKKGCDFVDFVLMEGVGTISCDLWVQLRWFCARHFVPLLLLLTRLVGARSQCPARVAHTRRLRCGCHWTKAGDSY